VTAPDLVEVIEAAMLAHTATWQSSGDFCEHAWLECECGETWDVENEPAAHLAHQARAVLAAITEAGAVEWGVRFADDGEIEPQTSRDSADDHIATWREMIADPNEPDCTAEDYEPMRIVTRQVFTHETAWTAVEG
jgi:hypothetical protein